MRVKIYAQKVPFNQDRLEILVFQEDARGNRFVIDNPTFKETDFDTISSNNTFCMNALDAQELMDELWNCGIRPTREIGTQGQLKATENHLADMKKLVFEYDVTKAK